MREASLASVGWRKYIPVVDGRRPVNRLARDGVHTGAWQWALVKRYIMKEYTTKAK